MVGPLLFSILQAGIERGFRAGLAVAGGIWASDVLYVLAVLYGMDALTTLTALPDFKVWAGLAGGMLLIAFGLGNLFLKKTAGSTHPLSENIHLLESSFKAKRTYFAFWLRGFLLNTVNPFTVFFWLGIAGAVIIPNGWENRQMMIFFGGMLGTLIVTDTLKAYAAKRVRHFLTPGHTRWVQWGIGCMLVLFGLALMVRVL